MSITYTYWYYYSLKFYCKLHIWVDVLQRFFLKVKKLAIR